MSEFHPFPKQPFELGCRYSKICTAPSFDGYHWKKITITDICHFSFCELFKNDGSLQPLKHRLVFPHPADHIYFIVVVFKSETGLPCDHWNVWGKKSLSTTREKLNILRDTLKIQRSASVMTPWSHSYFVSVNGSLDTLIGEVAPRKFVCLLWFVCTKQRQCLLVFKRKSIKCKQLFYLVQIYACI